MVWPGPGRAKRSGAGWGWAETPLLLRLLAPVVGESLARGSLTNCGPSFKAHVNVGMQ